MFYVDKFLNYLKTDRNTFVTYILALISIYFAVDRVVEMLFIIFTGMSSSYWGPITYTLVLACPIFAFHFSSASKFAKNDKTKATLFAVFYILTYIIAISMFVQSVNYFGWLLLISVPNYSLIATLTPEIITPAFQAIAVLMLVISVPKVFKFIYMEVYETIDILDSIDDYEGISLTVDREGTGPYTCEVELCKSEDKTRSIIIPENIRYQTALVVGISGTGKTTMVFEPMMARDIEKKAFFRSVSKEMGYTALKNGIATLNCPYTNEYINENFSLYMLSPALGKENIYFKYFKNLILNNRTSNILYKDLGFTFLAPDNETIETVSAVAKAYNMKVNRVDPTMPRDSIGLNPFVHNDPSKIGVIISSSLRNLYKALASPGSDEVIKENVAVQAIEHLSILLKEMYPRLNGGLLPNLEDMLNMLNNFDLVEEMCKEMETHESLAEKYNIQIGYFKKNFYKDGSGRAETQQNIYLATSQIDSLLRYPGVRTIVCNRNPNRNINFDQALANGEITLISTRRGELGEAAHKAFGMFTILSFQHSVLTRPGSESTRVPHFIYIDEFASYVGEATMPIFTLYRKYRVGTIISSQNLDQFNIGGNDTYRKTIVANCTTKLVFGNNTPEDNAWWAKDFGKKREWQSATKYVATEKGTFENEKAKIQPTEYGWTENVKERHFRDFKFKGCGYKTKNYRGKTVAGKGTVDFIEPKYLEPKKDKFYDFDQYNMGTTSPTKPKEPKVTKKDKIKDKFYKTVNFDNQDVVDPVQTDLGDISSVFTQDGGISINLKNKKNL